MPESKQYVLEDTLEFLNNSLKKVIKQHHQDILPTYEQILDLSIKANVDEKNYFKKIEDLLYDQSIEDIIKITIALNCFFHLSNLAEETARIESIRSYESSKENVGFSNNLAVSYKEIVDTQGEEKAKDYLNKIRFHPVLTAHPTEARRTNINSAIKKLQQFILVRPNLVGLTLIENERKILAVIESMYLSSPVNTVKPTVMDEIDSILDVFDSTFYEITPLVYRRISDFSNYLLGNDISSETVIEKPLVKFGSWVGSDRDGNPNVTNEITEKLCDIYYSHLIEKYLHDFDKLLSSLKLDTDFTDISKEVEQLINQLSKELSINIAQDLYTHNEAIVLIRRKLELHKYFSPYDIVKDLTMIQNSLKDNKAILTAFDEIETLIWKLKTFGFVIFRPEIRQHSKLHRDALNDKTTKSAKEILETFKMMNRIQEKFGPDSINRYIISFTHEIDDIKNIFELAKIALGEKFYETKINAIPLFETLEDIENSTNILDQALEIEEFKQMISNNKNRLEIMIGYSDSSKDVGPIAANFALDKVSRELATWGDKNDIKLILFHGRGGAVGRGGGPAKKAISSSPKNSVNNYFKITEQGESIMARYGNPFLATRHIEDILGAVLLQSNSKLGDENEENANKYSELAKQLSTLSKEKYLKFINTEGVVDYFYKSTPLDDISELNIGSRPAKRGLSSNSFEDLRAIPWVFSWSQARLNLAAWYGFGTAAKEFGDIEILQEAYKNWGFFEAMIDNLAMSIAKTNKEIAKLFLELGDREEITKELIDELELTKGFILKIRRTDELLSNQKTLSKSVNVRSPYLNALSLIQVFALKQINEHNYKSDKHLQDLKYLVRCSISGVAAGLQNTG